MLEMRAAAVENTAGRGASTGHWERTKYSVPACFCQREHGEHQQGAARCQDVLSSHKLGELGEMQQVKQQNGVERG